MFSPPTIKVPYFGLALQDAIDDEWPDQALAALDEAYRRCGDEDMRTERVRQALLYLSQRATRKGILEAFWTALEEPNPELRPEAVRKALKKVYGLYGRRPRIS